MSSIPIISLLFLTLPFYKLRDQKNKSILISKENSSAINGIFILLVFISHFLSYGAKEASLDIKLLEKLTIIHGQIMVAPFLVFSGYGIQSNIFKDANYIKERFKNRILNTFLIFCLAIIMYSFYNLMIGKHYPIKIIIQSFIGWKAVGNSNWFMFITFLNYLYIYLIFKLSREKNNINVIVLFLALLLSGFIILYFKEYNYYWVDTMLCISLGMMLKKFESTIINFLSIKTNYFILLISSIIAFILLKVGIPYNWIIHNIYSFIYVFILILINYQVSVSNKVLLFLSKYVFEIYIYQRIFFDLVINQLNVTSFYLSFFTSLFLTICWAVLIKKIIATIIIHKKRYQSLS